MTTVAAGIHWLRMPLPMELDHINLWLLEHDGGYVLVDTGLACEAGRATWEHLEREVLHARPLRLIVLTHFHPDHAGLAAWLQERHDVPVWTSARSDRQMRALLTPPPAGEIEARCAFLRAHGVENVDGLRAGVSGQRYREVVSGMPDVAHHPGEAQETIWADCRWRWIETDGHASGHLCLHAADAHVLISGDQILPTISPNVSLTGWGDDPDPLGSFLESLERLERLDPDTLVLPSHGRPFHGLRRRTQELAAHHAKQLRQLLLACSEPMTAYQTLGVLFKRSLSGMHQFFALGEAIAHLQHLVLRELLIREVDGRGVIRFRAAPPSGQGWQPHETEM